MNDARIVAQFGVSSHIIKPVVEGLSYNLYGYVYVNGFLNVFKEAATSNNVAIFLCTFFKQYGIVTVTNSSGEDTHIPVSFSDGVYDNPMASPYVLGSLFCDHFLPEESGKPGKREGGNPSGTGKPGKPTPKSPGNATNPQTPSSVPSDSTADPSDSKSTKSASGPPKDGK